MGGMGANWTCAQGTNGTLEWELTAGSLDMCDSGNSTDDGPCPFCNMTFCSEIESVCDTNETECMNRIHDYCATHSSDAGCCDDAVRCENGLCPHSNETCDNATAPMCPHCPGQPNIDNGYVWCHDTILGSPCFSSCNMGGMGANWTCAQGTNGTLEWELTAGSLDMCDSGNSTDDGPCPFCNMTFCAELEICDTNETECMNRIHDYCATHSSDAGCCDDADRCENGLCPHSNETCDNATAPMCPHCPGQPNIDNGYVWCYDTILGSPCFSSCNMGGMGANWTCAQGTNGTLEWQLTAGSLDMCDSGNSTDDGPCPFCNMTFCAELEVCDTNETECMNRIHDYCATHSSDAGCCDDAVRCENGLCPHSNETCDNATAPMCPHCPGQPNIDNGYVWCHDTILGSPCFSSCNMGGMGANWTCAQGTNGTLEWQLTAGSLDMCDSGNSTDDGPCPFCNMTFCSEIESVCDTNETECMNRIHDYCATHSSDAGCCDDAVRCENGLCPHSNETCDNATAPMCPHCPGQPNIDNGYVWCHDTILGSPCFSSCNMGGMGANWTCAQGTNGTLEWQLTAGSLDMCDSGNSTDDGPCPFCNMTFCSEIESVCDTNETECMNRIHDYCATHSSDAGCCDDAVRCENGLCPHSNETCDNATAPMCPHCPGQPNIDNGYVWCYDTILGSPCFSSCNMGGMGANWTCAQGTNGTLEWQLTAGSLDMCDSGNSTDDCPGQPTIDNGYTWCDGHSAGKYCFSYCHSGVSSANWTCSPSGNATYQWTLASGDAHSCPDDDGGDCPFCDMTFCLEIGSICETNETECMNRIHEFCATHSSDAGCCDDADRCVNGLCPHSNETCDNATAPMCPHCPGQPYVDGAYVWCHGSMAGSMCEGYCSSGGSAGNWTCMPNTNGTLEWQLTYGTGVCAGPDPSHCNGDDTRCSFSPHCGGHGNCSYGSWCDCNDGWYGDYCQYTIDNTTCPSISSSNGTCSHMNGFAYNPAFLAQFGMSLDELVDHVRSQYSYLDSDCSSALNDFLCSFFAAGGPMINGTDHMGNPITNDACGYSLPCLDLSKYLRHECSVDTFCLPSNIKIHLWNMEYDNWPLRALPTYESGYCYGSRHYTPCHELVCNGTGQGYCEWSHIDEHHHWRTRCACSDGSVAGPDHGCCDLWRYQGGNAGACAPTNDQSCDDHYRTCNLPGDCWSMAWGLSENTTVSGVCARFNESTGDFSCEIVSGERCGPNMNESCCDAWISRSDYGTDVAWCEFGNACNSSVCAMYLANQHHDDHGGDDDDFELFEVTVTEIESYNYTCQMFCENEGCKYEGSEPCCPSDHDYSCERTGMEFRWDCSECTMPYCMGGYNDLWDDHNRMCRRSEGCLLPGARTRCSEFINVTIHDLHSWDGVLESGDSVFDNWNQVDPEMWSIEAHTFLPGGLIPTGTPVTPILRTLCPGGGVRFLPTAAHGMQLNLPEIPGLMHYLGVVLNETQHCRYENRTGSPLSLQDLRQAYIAWSLDFWMGLFTNPVANKDAGSPC